MQSIRGLSPGGHGITGGRLRRPIIATLLAIGLATALSASAVARTAASASSQPAYLNASLAVQARVSDLLGRMTLPEKIGQMVQIEADPGHRQDQRLHQPGRVQPAQPRLRAEDPRGRPRRLDPGRRNRHPHRHHRQGWPRQHRPGLGHRVQHDAELRDRALAAAHSRHLRRRRRPRLRPPVPGAAVPAVHRDGRHLGSLRRPGGRGGHRERAPRHRLELGLRPGPGHRPGQPLGPLLRDLGGGAGAGRRHGRGERARPAERRRGRAEGHRHREALRRVLRIDQRPRPGPGRTAAPLPAGHVPAVLRGRHRRGRGHGHGGLRLDQRDPRDRVALPADYAAARPDGLQGRGDQRLR